MRRPGKLRWATEGREGDHASVARDAGARAVPDQRGDLIVARQEPAKFAEERRIEVADGETWAMPAFVPGGLVVRDAGGLIRLSWTN